MSQPSRLSAFIAELRRRRVIRAAVYAGVAFVLFHAVGATISGLNKMEHEGFSSAIIKGIIASADKLGKLV